MKNIARKTVKTKLNCLANSDPQDQIDEHSVSKSDDICLSRKTQAVKKALTEKRATLIVLTLN